MATQKDMRVGNPLSDRIKPSSLLRYSMLPGIIPRIRNMGTQFRGIAQMLAMIFYSAGLLPKGHPMLNPSNMGRFGFTDVIATAANNIQLNRQNIDKILIFSAVILALIMIVIQTVILIIYGLMSSAQASSTSTTGMFTNKDPENDVVFAFLQQAVGVDGFFSSASPIGFSIAPALHAMLGFYSSGLLIIAVLIVVYYIVVVVGEAAQSGRPFGGRFNSLWAPIRLVIALGLLVPFGSGLNASQYVVLYTAKAGSSFASNAWDKFYDIIRNRPDLTVVPPYPIGMADIGKSLFLTETCRAGYNLIQGTRSADLSDANSTPLKLYIFYPHQLPEAVAPLRAAFPDAEINTAIRVHRNSTSIILRWEHYGGINMARSDTAGGFSCANMTLTYDPGSTDASKKVALIALEEYTKAMGMMRDSLMPHAIRFAETSVRGAHNDNLGNAHGVDVDTISDIIIAADTYLSNRFLTTEGIEYSRDMLGRLFANSTTTGGWGTAATIYMQIARASSDVQRIFRESVPTHINSRTDSGPLVNEWVDRNSWATTDFMNNIDGRETIKKDLVDLLKRADENLLNPIANDISPQVPNRNFLAAQWRDDSTLTQLLKSIFAVDSLQAIADPNGVNVFPMVHLSNLGHELMVKALNAFFISGVAGFVSSILPFGGGLAAGIGTMAFFIGVIGLGAGFLLGIVIPLMPFIYFFFAIVEWVMGVIEALVGAPLWALAHLRIDGEGMPGPAATQGYFILFGILIKPFLILFALMASYVIFNAGAYMLNLTFGGAVGLMPHLNDHLLGVINIGILSGIQFVGYLIMYTVIVYNLGLVCFKMIDQIPAQAMRWMGQGNVHYQDGKTDPIGTQSQMAFAAAGIMAGQGMAKFAVGGSKAAGDLTQKGADKAGTAMQGKTDVSAGSTKK